MVFNITVNNIRYIVMEFRMQIKEKKNIYLAFIYFLVPLFNNAPLFSPEVGH